MGRPREFDEEQVVARAREAFWSNGVTATSVADISGATGLSVGSIYKAFDSKAELQQRTLDDYLLAGHERIKELFAEAATPREGIEAWIDLMAAQAGDDSPTGGCYAVFCAAELAETDPAVRSRLKRHDRLSLDQLSSALRDGDFSCDPRAGAQLLYTTASGLMIAARKGISTRRARDTLLLALSALD